ncbi:unnamed protein product [Rotaria magnacalcarata]
MDDNRNKILEILKLTLFIQQEETKQKYTEEVEATKRKFTEEATKRKELDLLLLHEQESRKELKLEQVPASTRNSRRRYSSSRDFYKFEVKKNIRDFGIHFLLEDDNHFEKKSLSDEYNYYESRTLKMFDYSPESIRTKDMTMTTNQQSKRIYLHKNTWIIFTKLLIMDMDMGFYQYTTLNLNYIGNLLNERYYIKRKLGRNPTSNVYFLEKNPNNIDKDDEKHCAIKICTQTKYLFYLNEIKIIQDLKQLNVSNKFHLFFEDIIYIHRQQISLYYLKMN